MSSSALKTPCPTSDCKYVGIFKCEGCQQIFCRKHVNEHRDALSDRLDVIVQEYNTLQRTMHESNDEINHQSLLQEIDTWEKESVEKIRQTANEARNQLDMLVFSSIGK